jgi:hypothetical protein
VGEDLHGEQQEAEEDRDPEDARDRADAVLVAGAAGEPVR